MLRAIKQNELLQMRNNDMLHIAQFPVCADAKSNDRTHVADNIKSVNMGLRYSNDFAQNCGGLYTFPQLYLHRYNLGGRPNGIWYARGAKWLNFIHELRDDKYPLCCYIYKITVEPDARILHIDNEANFEEFDRKYPSYWLNFDYIVAYFRNLNGEFAWDPHAEGVTMPTGKVLNKVYDHFSKLSKHRDIGELRKYLISEKAIFDTPEEAYNKSAFYKKLTYLPGTPVNERANRYPIEHFKFKDWSTVSRDYDGIYFGAVSDIIAKKSNIAYYYWLYSLDISSGCIWNAKKIKMQISFIKGDNDLWYEVAS